MQQIKTGRNCNEGWNILECQVSFKIWKTGFSVRFKTGNTWSTYKTKTISSDSIQIGKKVAILISTLKENVLILTKQKLKDLPMD